MTIPANRLVQINPSVLAGGGSALQLIGLFLTENTRVPTGQVLALPDALSVSNYFGASSEEYDQALDYFAGYAGATAAPGSVLFFQYAPSATSAYLRGGSTGAMTLAQLQAISGTMSVVVDGVTKNSGSVNFNSPPVTSFSNAAEVLGAALGIEGVTTASVTGSISGTTFTVASVTSGSIAVGDVLSGTGVTANTYVTGFLGGTGGVGTYSVSPSQVAASQTISVFQPGVFFDSIASGFVINSGTTGPTSTLAYATGSLATSLFLTQATGAVLSQGIAALNPTTAMTKVISLTQDWCSFTHIFDPDNGSGNANKLLFSQWTSQQNNRYAYVPGDSDSSPTQSQSAPSSLGAEIAAAGYSGTIPTWQIDGTYRTPAFIMGAIAAIDFTALNGRVTLAYKSQPGIVPSVEDATTASNLEANGYNYYGAWATAAQQFQGLAPGSISGPFKFIDSYVNQIWMTSQFQLALMLLLFQARSIPYNPAGNDMISAALGDPIQAAVNFGAIRSGVILSQQQAIEVNTAAGVPGVDKILTTRGWYLQVLPASPEVRAARGSPPCTFWYTDGGSVQKINLASITLT